MLLPAFFVIFPFRNNSVNHRSLLYGQVLAKLAMEIPVMGMRGNPQVCVVHVNLLLPFILVVEIHNRFQVVALDMGVNATARHRLHKRFAVPTVLGYEFNIPDGQQCVALAPVRVLGIAIFIDASPTARASTAQPNTHVSQDRLLLAFLRNMGRDASLCRLAVGVYKRPGLQRLGHRSLMNASSLLAYDCVTSLSERAVLFGCLDIDIMVGFIAKRRPLKIARVAVRGLQHNV